ncbi:MAG: hypothetical protein AB7T63_11100 [Planctomycetota bacterium]
MGIRPESRWWVVTLAVVAVLIAISLLAIDRPNVVWSRAKPHCPACRSEVAPYSSRCAACSTSFDWVIADNDACPLCRHDLGTLEAEHVHERIRALGDDVASQRVADKLGVSKESGHAYLASLGRGRCGWCGGRGIEPGAEGEPETSCRLCGGGGACAACGGDRRVQLGIQAAHLALAAWRADIEDLGTGVPEEARRREHARLTQAFFARHAGTAEALEVTWPAPGGGGAIERVVDAARARLEQVVEALAE